MTGFSPTGLSPTGLTSQMSAGSGDVTAPILSSQTGTNTGKYSAIGSVSTNEDNGILYYVTNTSATASSATVKAGGAQTVVTSGVQNITITGLTAGTGYYNHFLHRDAAGNDSSIATSAQWFTEDELAPQGIVSIDSITVGSGTASVFYSYSDIDATGFEYRIDGGTATTATASPINLTGLTNGVTYTVEVRAVNVAGVSAWSTPVDLTPFVAAVGTFTTGVLRKLVGGAVLANTALNYFRLYNPNTGALVLNRTNLSTDSNGRVTCVDAAITAGIEYRSDWLAATGECRMSKKAAT
jgi:hypothetical protein